MAVRRVRSDVSGTTYALVFFIFIAVIAVSLAIMFYVGRNRVERDLAAAQDEFNVFARQDDRAQQATQKLVDEARKKDRSVVNHLVLETARLKRLITGSADMAVDQVEQALAAKDVKGGQTVISTLDRLRGERVALEGRLKNLEAQVADRNKQIEAANANLAKVRAAGEEQIKQLTGELAAIKNAATGFQASTDEKIKTVEEGIARAQGEAEKQVQGYQNQLKALQTEIVKLRLRNDELVRIIKAQAPEVGDPTKEADGRIIANDPDRNVVYVNLGRGDHLVLGMTFEVFDPQRGVQVDNNGRPRGVATVEIVDIGEDSATARVVRSTPGRPALVNDIIVNQVYDRNRTYKFYVMGEFDLDADGQYTMADHDLVEEMIRRWGGQVVKPAERARQLSASLGKEAAESSLMPVDTDFLVIGKEPELPRPLPPGTDDPQRIRESIEQKRRWDQFIQLTAEAKSLSVPILNQNRFLTLIGYYRR